MDSKLYSPPDGYFDLPFTWAFDASIFANGSSPLGSSIYLLGGYGDFALRRVVGLNRILASDGTGKFQISRRSRNVYLQSDPVQAPNSVELAIAPEEVYLETGRIWFDLYGINLPSAPNTAQLAFQGVRRQQGKAIGPAYKHFAKSFTYQVTEAITALTPTGPYVTNTKIVDYDFELYQVMVFAQVAGVSAPVVVTTPICSLQIFDSNRVAISNLPILDIFYNGAPGTPYQNGAMVPPLYYPVNSTLEIDFYSQVTNGKLLPTSITVYLIGRQLIPC